MALSIFLYILYGIVQLYFFVIIISFILSWIPGCNNFKVCRMINNASGWYMDFFRGKLILGIFDMGSLVGYIIYQTIAGLLLQCLVFLI